MAIPSVVQGLIEAEDGRVFELDSPKGAAWLETVTSFRYEPTGGNKPYTVRKESGKGSDYWYGYRKMAGKLHKKYIGKTSELSIVKLEKIAEALNTPPLPRVTEVTDKVTEVTDKVTEVTDKVTHVCDTDRLTALELQVQVLQKSLEALREALPGKSDAGDLDKLPIVTDKELHTRICNLQTENEALKVEYAKILKTSGHIKAGREKEIAELRSQLDRERADREEVEAELADLKQKSASASNLSDKAAKILSFIRPHLAKKVPTRLLAKFEEILRED
jgi:predicted  nucleic acid-binding Zn-ribbon protein